ncbi:MAG TPA: type II secretion system minor pseudopilin GspK [Solimonas sp.]|nr:type II secretion system minor pseudopilin GspK [Solimonas sp.]
MDRPGQRGIALITALLVVALAAIAAAAILTSANHAIHRAQNLQDSEKAWWYADGVEAWVKSILERDLENKDGIDSLKDDWARPVDYLPIDEGALRGGVIDLQGRYNLNNLSRLPDKPDPQHPDPQRDIFLRLVQNIQDAPGQRGTAAQMSGQELFARIRDWTDKDSEVTGADGAEDSDYLGGQFQYRVPNRPMADISELLAIKGMTKELYQQLLCCVTTLPQAGTPVNINTAPEPVLRALVAKPTPQLDAFVSEREDKPATTPDPLMFGGADAPAAMLATKSEFFMLRADIAVGGSRLLLNSTIHRPYKGHPAVIARSTNVDGPALTPAPASSQPGAAPAPGP